VVFTSEFVLSKEIQNRHFKILLLIECTDLEDHLVWVHVVHELEVQLEVSPHQLLIIAFLNSSDNLLVNSNLIFLALRGSNILLQSNNTS